MQQTRYRDGLRNGSRQDIRELGEQFQQHSRGRMQSAETEDCRAGDEPQVVPLALPIKELNRGRHALTAGLGTVQAERLV